MNSYKAHPNHEGTSYTLKGVYVQFNFISEDEETQLIKNLDEIPWDPSQSGRRKQNFGPKCNFKKKKLKVGDFQGFPKCSKFIQDKFTSVEMLKDYKTIEQCSLEYNPERGASIDPHIDDCWVWGERIVTVNLVSDTVLTLRPYRGGGDATKYNLSMVPASDHSDKEERCVVVRVPMPRRSLIVLYSDARYNWEHFVCREDIVTRRVCLAYREFTKPYLPGGELENVSKEILERANVFF